MHLEKKGKSGYKNTEILCGANNHSISGLYRSPSEWREGGGGIGDSAKNQSLVTYRENVKKTLLLCGDKQKTFVVM